MKKYLLSFLILLIVEIAIAVFHFHPFVRGFLGDVLVVLLLFSFLKLFFSIASEKLAIGILLFAFTVELLQFFDLVETLNIQSKLLRIVLGSVFDWWDLLAYTVGTVIIFVFEYRNSLKQ